METPAVILVGSSAKMPDEISTTNEWGDALPRFQYIEFCWIHHKPEFLTDDSYVCFECNHVFLTPYDLVLDDMEVRFNSTGYLLMKREKDIEFCPHCLHDF